MISGVFRRIDITNLFDLPFNIVHELYRNAFLASQEQKEKEEQEESKRKEEERRQEEEYRRNNAQQRGPRQSSVPMKQPMQTPPINESENKTGYASAAMDDAMMSEFEDMLGI